ncbi:hypothetical protein [Amycolatopsis sp. FDAARGOS 1241]|uniref:hypothetical protein n=1 Tax=Amycolatopsis sp. FDAARGOS 1241 TaxID=2778070 RepID=UPI0019525442|nr:hypothetical protein [Amycolatopsis sp. FDAARGOS 1241]QRP49284.1 hypothetical protein I6J71_16840 [Amycolatopsis sp. FDAARGOS 1241]
MRIESDGHSRGNPRLYELVEDAPDERPGAGHSPTVRAWPEFVDFLKVAGRPVAGPWPPHQRPRPDPEEDTLPTAVAEPPETA